jgi:hypothetical protein
MDSAEPFSTFDEFREQLKQSVARMQASLDDLPEATWPAVLFLELHAEGLVIGEIRSVAGFDDSDKQAFVNDVLAERIRRSKARRFGLVIPAWRHDVYPAQETLVLVAGERGRVEAVVVDVVRGRGAARFGPWSAPTVRVSGPFVDPLAAALSGQRLMPSCPDCSAQIGERHNEGCDVERCSICYGQRLLCDCDDHDPLAEAWQGEWPGAAECRAYGWWALRTDDGWRPCPPETPGAREDINRLIFYRQTGFDCLYERAA